MITLDVFVVVVGTTIYSRVQENPKKLVLELRDERGWLCGHPPTLSHGPIVPGKVPVYQTSGSVLYPNTSWQNSSMHSQSIVKGGVQWFSGSAFFSASMRASRQASQVKHVMKVSRLPSHFPETRRYFSPLGMGLPHSQQRCSFLALGKVSEKKSGLSASPQKHMDYAVPPLDIDSSIDRGKVSLPNAVWYSSSVTARVGTTATRPLPDWIIARCSSRSVHTSMT